MPGCHAHPVETGNRGVIEIYQDVTVALAGLDQIYVYQNLEG